MTLPDPSASDLMTEQLEAWFQLTRTLLRQGAIRDTQASSLAFAYAESQTRRLLHGTPSPTSQAVGADFDFMTPAGERIEVKAAIHRDRKRDPSVLVRSSEEDPLDLLVVWIFSPSLVLERCIKVPMTALLRYGRPSGKNKMSFKVSAGVLTDPMIQDFLVDFPGS